MKCPHFSQLITVQAAKYASKNVLWFKPSKSTVWEPISWTNFSLSVDFLANALFDLGVAKQQNVGILAPNMPESFMVDFAAFAIQAVSVPMYSTSSISQVEYIIADANISLLFVGEQSQYDIAYELMIKSSTLKQIIIYDENVRTHGEENSIFISELLRKGQYSDSKPKVDHLRNTATDDLIANILYTSGTTGESKGVILTHSNYIASLTLHTDRLVTVSDSDRSISFLPMNHVFERSWCYFCFFIGVEIYVNKVTSEIMNSLQQVKPTIFCSVPRFWEKIYNAYQHKLESKSAFQQGLFAWAQAVGHKYHLEHDRLRIKPSFLLHLSYRIADKLMFSKLRLAFGVSNANILPTAGAALADEILEFFRSIGVPILYGYGLTETTATVSCFETNGYVLGSVGCVLSGIEVKLGEDNEILVKGETVTPGYFNKPEATKAAFTEDGFFRTGDAGEIVNNHINLSERIKDLFKTSNGSCIAPQQIEAKLISDKYIDQAVVIGDGRNFVSAIISPNHNFLKDLAHKLNIKFVWVDELMNRAEILDFYYSRVNDLQNDRANFEKIKKIALIPKSFTFESGELTNTFKIRRAIIMQKYASLIEQIYED